MRLECPVEHAADGARVAAKFAQEYPDRHIGIGDAVVYVPRSGAPHAWIAYWTKDSVTVRLDGEVG